MESSKKKFIWIFHLILICTWKEKKVCKLKKVLYGLKQSPRDWFGRLAKVMINVGYKQSHDDHTFFVKHSTSMGVTAQLGYVDDIIVIGNDLEEREALK